MSIQGWLMRGLLALLSVVVIILVVLLLLPSPIQSVAWQPGPMPQWNGVLAINSRLHDASLIAEGQLNGPEDLAIDGSGRIYAGMQDGRIVRVEGDRVETFVSNTGGRPLGVAFDAAGNLLVCDAWKGLLSVAPSGKVTTLTTSSENLPFGFTDDLDVASDGKVYFSDASSKWHQPDYLMDFLEGKPYGRLLEYDPATHQTRTLLKGLYFANGVALSSHEDYVLVAETYRYRITRYWLKGPKAGTSDIFADNLPGLPDNIESDRAGTLWVALPTPRKTDADFAASHAWAKELVAKLPRVFWPKPKRYGLVVALNENGQITQSLHDASGEHLRMITSVQPFQGALYFGSLENDRIGRLVLGDHR